MDNEKSAGPQTNERSVDRNGCGQQSAKDLLRVQIRHLQRELDMLHALHALLNSLPDAMAPGVDEALWNLISRSK